MSLKTVLFDLDGTLLPMDQSIFIYAYFGELSKKLEPYGYKTSTLVNTILEGTSAMVENDGRQTNETVFWNFFTGIFGKDVAAHIPMFEAFYRDDFDKISTVCGFSPMARKVIDDLHARDIATVLATNPVFPAIATQKRIQWAGLSPSDFSLITTYENSCHCKPNPDYYRDILHTLDLCAEECLMVGNDVDEDMVAQTLGMNVFLLTDCLINKHEKSLDDYPHGNFEDLLRFLDKI